MEIHNPEFNMSGNSVPYGFNSLINCIICVKIAALTGSLNLDSPNKFLHFDQTSTVFIRDENQSFRMVVFQILHQVFEMKN